MKIIPLSQQTHTIVRCLLHSSKNLPPPFCNTTLPVPNQIKRSTTPCVTCPFVYIDVTCAKCPAVAAAYASSIREKHIYECPTNDYTSTLRINFFVCASVLVLVWLQKCIIWMLLAAKKQIMEYYCIIRHAGISYAFLCNSFGGVTRSERQMREEANICQFKFSEKCQWVH